ncbi:MAG: SdrD B-like domain-containing protein, partial [Pseudomonadota bacterium]|nr:SdrD B-like domain-containing protein [Pseudomonadota bacterium]
VNSTVSNGRWADYRGEFVHNLPSGDVSMRFESLNGLSTNGNFLDDIQVELAPVVEFAGATITSPENTATPPAINITLVGVVPAGGMNLALTVAATSTATIGVDYTINGQSNPSFNVFVPAGDYQGGLTIPVPVQITNDTIAEGDELFSVTLQPSPTDAYRVLSTTACGGNAIGSANYTIIDDDIELRLQKNWVNATVADQAQLSTSGLTNNINFISTANSANTSDLSASVNVHPNETATLAELLVNTNQMTYSASQWSCIGGGNLVGNQISFSNADLGQDITCRITNTALPLIHISGRVFEDNSGTTAMAANAYNGTQETGEQGIVGSSVQLTNCGVDVIATTQTDAAGGYQFAVQSSSLSSPNFCIRQTNLVGYTSVSGSTGYARATDTITLANTGATDYANHNFGDARLNLILTTDGQQTTIAGGTVNYTHILRSTAVLDVGAFVTNSAENPQLGWTTVLYRDDNCNGVIDSNESALSASVGQLLPNQDYCVVQRVNAPAQASGGAQHVAHLTASYSATLQDGGTVTGDSNTRHDTTVISTSSLIMSKQVRVVANCPSTATDSTLFSDRNQAKNGDFLEYEILYRNVGTRNLSQVRVRDAVPSGTLFKSAHCEDTPASAICQLETQPALDSQQGELSWLVTNTVPPAQQGTVRFCVQVPPLIEPPIH